MKKGMIMQPIETFTHLWAQGEFDRRDYYVLTAPINEWSTAHPMHCVSEHAGALAEEGWGIVVWHLVVNIYSDKELALQRARHLGGNVKPLYLKCLKCFVGAFSTWFTYADMILDEKWHIDSCTCRDNEKHRGVVSHVRLCDSNGIYELNGCMGNDSLVWDPIREYGEPNRPQEWCRPVSLPQGMIMNDHSPQGGPVDLEIVSEAETLSYFSYNGQTYATEPTNDRIQQIYARPIGDIAFANLQGEKIRITCGEGIWVPIAFSSNGIWSLYPWSSNYEDVVNKYASDDEDVVEGQLTRDAVWFTNKALRILEDAFLDEEKNDKDKATALATAKDLMAKGCKLTPRDWYSNAIYDELCRSTVETAKSVIHADRINWKAYIGADFDSISEEFADAVNINPNNQLVYHNMALAYRAFQNDDQCESLLEKLLGINPRNAQANYDLAICYLQHGDEETEIAYYLKAIEADPSHALSYYNLGKTYEEQGDYGTALDYYKQAMESDENLPQAFEQAAFIMQHYGMIDDAKKMRFQALGADFRRIATYDHIWEFCKEINDFDLHEIAMETMAVALPREYFHRQKQSLEGSACQ